MARSGQEVAAEARMRPGRLHRPARVAALRREAERGIAAEVVGVIDGDRAAGQRCASMKAKKPRRRCCRRPAAAAAAGRRRDLGLAPRPRGSLRPKRSSARSRSRSRWRRRSGRDRAGRRSGRALHASRHRRPLRRSSACGARGGCRGHRDRLGGERQLARDVAAAGDTLAALDHRLGRRGPVGDDQQRPVMACGPPQPSVIEAAPAPIATAGRRPGTRRRRSVWPALRRSGSHQAA